MTRFHPASEFRPLSVDRGVEETQVVTVGGGPTKRPSVASVPDLRRCGCPAGARRRPHHRGRAARRRGQRPPGSGGTHRRCRCVPRPPRPSRTRTIQDSFGDRGYWSSPVARGTEVARGRLSQGGRTADNGDGRLTGYRSDHSVGYNGPDGRCPRGDDRRSSAAVRDSNPEPPLAGTRSDTLPTHSGR